MGFIYFSFSTYFCFMAFCVFMVRFFVSSKILILACSSAVIHGSKNIYFQKQMFPSTSWMCYRLYNNFTRQTFNMCFNCSIEVTQHARFFILYFIFLILFYIFSYIIIKLFPIQRSLMTLALGFLYCSLWGDIFLV